MNISRSFFDILLMSPCSIRHVDRSAEEVRYAILYSFVT